MSSSLVIAVGNRMRGDDGVAHAVADALERALPPHATLRRVHALDIVLAEEVAAARSFVVIDAARREAPPVLVERIEPGPAPIGAHDIDAQALLGLAQAVFGAAPPAVLVSVAAPSMGHAERLSDTALAAVPTAADAVLRTLADLPR